MTRPLGIESTSSSAAAARFGDCIDGTSRILADAKQPLPVGVSGGADKTSGSLARVLVMASSDDAADEGRCVALGRLQDPARAGRQVESKLRAPDAQPVEVDDIEVRPKAWGDDAAITKAVELGIGAAQLPHEELDGEPLTASPVACPVGQVKRRRRAVRDEVHV